MKYFLSLISVALILGSCSEDTSKEKKTSSKETVPKVEKHIVDLNEEQYSLDELIKIDKEIPVIEVLVPSNWNQQQITGLGKLEILKDVSFKDTDLKETNLEFLSERRTVKTLSFENCQISAETLKGLSSTVLEEVTFNNTSVDDSIIEILKKAPRLKEVKSSTPDKLKAALPKVKISKI